MCVRMHMNSESELVEAVRGIVEKRGKAAIEQARKEILSLRHKGGIVSSAVQYFARVTIQGGLPVFPALISLSCEAVGGKTEKVGSVGAAMSLIAGAADIHDDIIDRSSVKYSKKTVYGKFGGDIALLAGDSLLIQGVTFLQRECESLSKEQRQAILFLIPGALFEISNAEAMETRMRKRIDVKPEELFEVIRMKAVVPEVLCRIGAILGGADDKSARALGYYGRTFGVVSIVRDEFIDLVEYPELQGRIKNECLPLPLLYALQYSKIREEIEPLVESPSLTQKDADRIVKITLSCEEVKKLKKDMTLAVAEGLKAVRFIAQNRIKEMALLLQAVTVDL